MPTSRIGLRSTLALTTAAVGFGAFWLPDAAHAQSASLRLPAAASPADVLPAGTPLPVRLNENLNSKTARVGQSVTFTVTRDVRAGSTVVIPAETPVAGVVTVSHGPGAFGRAGVLRLTCDTLTLPDGRHVAVSMAEAESTGETGSSRAGAAGVTGGLSGLAVGWVTYVAVDLDENFSRNRSDHTGPALAGLGAGLASGFLIGSLFHGGGVHLEAGRSFTVILTHDLPVVTPPPPSP